MGLCPPMNHAAYVVTKTNWQLYSGLTAATLTLTGAAPTVSFRCAITLSTTTGHSDCSGTVIVNAEVITFVGATKKTSTLSLSGLPTITTANLDCNILVECIDASGASIQNTVNTPIKIRWEDYTKAIQDAQGNWGMATGSKAYTKDMTIGDLAVIQFDKLNDTNPAGATAKLYKVNSTQEIGMTLGGRTLYRVLYF